MLHQSTDQGAQGWFRRQFADHDVRKSPTRLSYQAGLLQPYLDRQSRVLDVGCGNGLLGAHLRQTTGCTVVGMDVTDLRAVDEDFLLFDGARFPCPNASVDFVLLSFVLHHSRDPFTVCQEALRVVRRGIFVFEDIPATRAQFALLAAHIVFFSWLYGISRPAKLPWDFPYIDALGILQSSSHVQVTNLHATRFKQIYPMSRQLYACML